MDAGRRAMQEQRSGVPRHEEIKFRVFVVIIFLNFYTLIYLLLIRRYYPFTEQKESCLDS